MTVVKQLMQRAFFRKTNNENVFDVFMDSCSEHHNEPAASLSLIRARDDRKAHGDLFESFCVLYMKEVKKHPDVWLLHEVPISQLESLGMQRRDVGIDIVSRDSDGFFHAIQCKFCDRSGPKKDLSLSWRALSTFFALCLRRRLIRS
jgi:predicted helicase